MSNEKKWWAKNSVKRLFLLQNEPTATTLMMAAAYRQHEDVRALLGIVKARKLTGEQQAAVDAIEKRHDMYASCQSENG
jgi:hypothetical protein